MFPRNCVIIGSAEVLEDRYGSSKKALKSDHANIEALLSHIPGYYELGLYMLLRIGPRH